MEEDWGSTSGGQQNWADSTSCNVVGSYWANIGGRETDNACWVRVELSTGDDRQDTTTRAAALEGDPVRLVDDS